MSPPCPSPQDDEGGAELATELAWRDSIEALLWAARLSPLELRVLSLYFNLGRQLVGEAAGAGAGERSLADVGRMLDCTGQAVSLHLQRAMVKVQDVLQAELA